MKKIPKFLEQLEIAPLIFLCIWLLIKDYQTLFLISSQLFQCYVDQYTKVLKTKICYISTLIINDFFKVLT